MPFASSRIPYYRARKTTIDSSSHRDKLWQTKRKLRFPSIASFSFAFFLSYLDRFPYESFRRPRRAISYREKRSASPRVRFPLFLFTPRKRRVCRVAFRRVSSRTYDVPSRAAPLRLYEHTYTRLHATRAYTWYTRVMYLHVQYYMLPYLKTCASVSYPLIESSY